MAGATDFALDALDAYLPSRVDGIRTLVGAEKFSGGQSNPTYLLTDRHGKRYVLRKQPSGTLLPSAHAVDREYRVMEALEPTSVPVARMLCYCDDARVIGTPFYLMEFVEGRIFWDPALPELDETERRALYDDMSRVVAALHGVDYRAAGLGDYGKEGNFLARQIGRWTKQYLACATETIPAMDQLIRWLPAHLPADHHDRTTIFHGDLRLDNMIVHPHEPRIVALLDWELSTLGHPIADLAYHALPWRLTSEQFRGMAEKVPLPPGIPTERAYLEAYGKRTGQEVDPALYEFCVAYSLFRLAAILQGILRRSLDGTASSTRARETGLRARAIAEEAWRQVSERGVA